MLIQFKILGYGWYKYDHNEDDNDNEDDEDHRVKNYKLRRRMHPPT